MTIVSEPKVLVSQPEKQTSLSDRLTDFLNRLQPSPEALILISALLIGGGSGLAMVLFHKLIELCQILTFENLLGKLTFGEGWTLACIPPLGGLIVGLLYWCFPDYIGQGFSALLSNTREQKISPLRPIIKMLAAAVSLGTGASLGPEGPSVEIGSNIGFILGQLFQVSKDRYRVLLGAGAAAGIAAGFNAPIAGVFFALEVVLGTSFTTPAISLILLSAVVSSIVARIFFGVHPAFDLPIYEVHSNWEWLLYLGLGLLASIVSLAYTQAIKFAECCFRGEVKGLKWFGLLPIAMRPVIGGVCVGLVALQLPHILGIGYGTLEAILREGGQFPLSFLCLLLVVKLIVTAISLGSGLVGGIFAPAMFIGAALGAIYSNVLAVVLPASLSEVAPSPAYAMVGMAAVLAGSAKAPLTAILLLFELTRNYLIILPLMAAVGVCVWVVDQITSSKTVAELNLQQMGVNLERQNELEVLQQVPIATIMDYSYLALQDSMLMLEAGWTMIEEKCHTALVFNGVEQLIGVVTLADIKRRLVGAANQSLELEEEKLGDVCITEILYAHEDESVFVALERMDTRGIYLLPVVARDNLQKVLGVIERNRLSLVGDLAVTQEALRPYLLKLSAVNNIRR